MAKETVDWHPASGYGFVVGRDESRIDWNGLTKREYFASHCMGSMMAFCVTENVDFDQLARDSVRAADALIEALNQKKDG